jgi:epoxyqueuosine reductase
MTASEHASLIKQHARHLAFDAVDIADLSPTQHRDSLDQWLANGMAGDMVYMARQAPLRRDPSGILPGATRAVVVTRHYDHREDTAPPPPGIGRVAKYARGPDYHRTLRPALLDLADFARSLGGPATVAKAYVDAGPVPERELAQRAGLGWIGKNTMLIDPHRGSYSFLGTVLTNLELTVDEPFDADRCGTCRRCLDACPTGAFVDERTLDARRCIAYLTIEHKGEIDPVFAPSVGNWVFGCDVCQDVCPWNTRFASSVAGVRGDSDMARLDLSQLIAIDDEAFMARFGATPLTRPGPNGMRRNARVAAANVGAASC